MLVFFFIKWSIKKTTNNYKLYKIGNPRSGELFSNYFQLIYDRNFLIKKLVYKYDR